MDRRTEWRAVVRLGLLYAVVGPTIGWGVLLLASAFRSAVIESVPISNVLNMAYLVLPFAYVMGAAPAFLTGVLCVLAIKYLGVKEVDLTAPIISAVLGGVLSAVAFAATHALAGQERYLSSIVMQFLAVGASAGLICAFLFRGRIDAIARPARHA